MNSRARISVAALSLSAAAFVGLVVKEGYSDRAIIPTKGDVPTVGFGSTIREDGSRVQMGDTITPVRAVQLAAAHLGKDEAAFRASMPGVALHQAEYDLYMDFVYQYGMPNWQASSMRRHLIAGEYRQACDALLRWRFQAGRDCRDPANWGPQGCKGVWTRQQERHQKCVAAQ